MNTLSDLTHAEARRHTAEQRLQAAIRAIEEAIQGGAERLTPALVAEYNAAHNIYATIEAING